jgi:preprotein translocase subunit SecE
VHVSPTSDDAAENVVERAERDRKSARGPFARIWLFLKQIVAELRQVVTPTRHELLWYFVGMLVFIVVMVLILGGLDFGFGKLVVFIFGKPSS